MPDNTTIAAGTVEVILMVPRKSVDPTLLEAPLHAFVADVNRIAQGAGQTLDRITLAFVDAQPEVNTASATASAGRNVGPSEQELAHEARLAEARKLLADIGQGEKDAGDLERKRS